MDGCTLKPATCGWRCPLRYYSSLSVKSLKGQAMLHTVRLHICASALCCCLLSVRSDFCFCLFLSFFLLSQSSHHAFHHQIFIIVSFDSRQQYFLCVFSQQIFNISYDSYLLYNISTSLLVSTVFLFPVASQMRKSVHQCFIAYATKLSSLLLLLFLRLVRAKKSGEVCQDKEQSNLSFLVYVLCINIK